MVLATGSLMNRGGRQELGGNCFVRARTYSALRGYYADCEAKPPDLARA